MNYIDYRKQLGISWTDEDNTKAFRVKILNILERIRNNENCYVDEDEYLCFCNNANVSYSDWDGFDYYYRIISVLHQTNKSFEELLVRCVAFINCFKASERRKSFKKMICDCLEEACIPIEILHDKDGYFIFPKGAKELDEALVSEMLIWVKNYPKTYKKYCEALKRYSRKEYDNISDIADDFRKVLETFFQEFFNRNKSLENMKSIYGDFLKERGLPSELSSEFINVLNSYTSFMNNYAKHHDATSEKTLEYIMYQTGNIIRLVINLDSDT